MIKKGIILAGGLGTRMSPITKSVNKQLLPIYDKPLIYYPLSILMLAGIRDILIIVNKGQVSQFKKVLKNGENFGVKIHYKEQIKPNGLPEAFIIGEKFINNDGVALILGDNFFYAQSLTKTLQKITKLQNGAKVFLHPVNNPKLYGIATVKNRKIIRLKEKPSSTKSKLAVTGLYFFDKNVVKLSKKLRPSKRKELEIIDLLNKYKVKNKLTAEFLGRGGAWLDAGSIDDYYDTTSFVSTIQKRQGFKIACLEEIALNKSWINKKKLNDSIKFYGNCDYSRYLKKLLT
ncbi:sugar phosphate nucleotidyltransferase [Pelagibacteraceae bacterium]|nr:sugar phosphate nucleotidyltransferase [Pelagibacteraceae bacterium]